MRLRNILVMIEAVLIRKALKEYLLAEMNDTSVTGIDTLREAESLVLAQKFDAIVISSDVLREDARPLLKNITDSSVNSNVPLIVLDETPTQSKTALLDEFGLSYYPIPLSMTERLRTTLDNVCSPRNWREHERISISNALVTIQIGEEDVSAELINLSRSGILCSIHYKDYHFNPFQKVKIKITFPDEYERLSLEGIPCRLVQAQVVSWLKNGTPDTIRIVWQMARLSELQSEILERIFQIY